MIACPDEATGSFCVWIQPVQGPQDCITGELVPHYVQIPSPVLSMALVSYQTTRSVDVDPRSLEREFPIQCDTKVRLVVATAECVLVYMLELNK